MVTAWSETTGHAAALEATLIGPRLRFRRAALVAISGPGRDERAFELAAGDELDVGRLEQGARAYVCVRGGIAVAPVLGSRSTDLLTGLGPAPLRAGDVLAVGPEPRTSPEPRCPPACSTSSRSCTSTPARVTTGSRLTRSRPSSGLRGAYRRIRIASGSDWKAWRSVVPGPTSCCSEGVVTGALQVPPSGLPILLLNDHPTTGGYPVLAVVTSDDLPLAGQLRPGDRVSFRR